jgi:hypothetical protein
MCWKRALSAKMLVLVLWKENFYFKEVRVSGKVEGEGGEGRANCGH